MKAKQFLRKLQAFGVEVASDRDKGGHYRLILGKRYSVVSFHGAVDLSPEYLKDICKQLGLDWKQVF